MYFILKLFVETMVIRLCSHLIVECGLPTKVVFTKVGVNILMRHELELIKLIREWLIVCGMEPGPRSFSPKLIVRVYFR